MGSVHSHINDVLLEGEIDHSAEISLSWDIPLMWDVSPHINSLYLKLKNTEQELSVALQKATRHRSSRSEVFCKKILENSQKDTCCRFQPATSLKERLWHICFSVNFAKFLRTPFLTKDLRRLLSTAKFSLLGLTILNCTCCRIKY